MAVQPEPEQDDFRPWAIYARLSTKADGGLEKVDYQVKMSEDYAASRGIPTDPALVFKDESLSAWKKRVRRPEWDQLMALAEAGAFPGILVYAVDRFTRRPKDLEALIELADEHGVMIDGPRSGRLDLTTATGRQQARWMAMQAASESDNTSERVKIGLRRKMERGKPMGAGRAWGWEKGGTVQRPDEVAVIREVAQRMLAGESNRSIVADLNARGVRTAARKDKRGLFTTSELSRMMARPRNGGHVELHGRIVGTIPGEPILDPTTYEDLQALLACRRRGRPATGRHLLTGILLCEKCSTKGGEDGADVARTMNGVTLVDGYRRYFCPNDREPRGCRRCIGADGVEKMVNDYMVELLSDPSNAQDIAREDAALSDARATQAVKVEAIEEQLAELETKWAAGDIIKRAYDRAKPVLDRRLAVAQAKIEEFGQSASPVPIDVAADWAVFTNDEKRAAIKRLGIKVTIGPWQRGNGPLRFDPERVKITR